jgi:hypothetical protein
VDYEQLVESKVEAACWSPDGKHIAYSTDDRSLHIATSSLENEFSVDLPADLHEDEDDPTLKGKWRLITFLEYIACLKSEALLSY